MIAVPHVALWHAAPTAHMIGALTVTPPPTSRHCFGVGTPPPSTSQRDMKPAEFRRIVLSLPEVVEGSHMGHADFRVNGKIIATLGYPSEDVAVVMLTPQDQDLIVRDHPAAFTPVKGKWGESGSTTVVLKHASKMSVAAALEAAWRKRAPKRLHGEFDRLVERSARNDA
jgi:hypothetical protein